MYRETCPDDMGDVGPRDPPGRAPSPLLIVLPIATGLAVLVLVAALHSALGAPLGPGWGVEVWSMIKSAVWPTIACAGIGAYVRLQALTTGAHRQLPPSAPDDLPPRRLATGGHRVIQIGHGPDERGGRSGCRPRRWDDEGDEE